MQQTSLIPPQPAWLPQILSALGAHEYLLATQLAALVGQPRDEVDRVLERLVHDGHVGRVVNDPTRPAAHVLKRAGALYLAELTGEEPVPVRRPRSTHMLDHELLLTDLAIVLRLLDRAGTLSLLRWETDRDVLADAITLRQGKRIERIPLVADGYAVVDVAGTKTALLIEIDMGTVSLDRMRTKYEGFIAWWKGGGPERHFGIKSLRLLTIAKHEAREARLRAVAAEAAGSQAAGFLWFGAADALDPGQPARFLEPRFRTARSDVRPCPLFAPVTRA